MSSTIYIIEFSILLFAIILLAILYGVGTWPFNTKLDLRDPRTWQDVPSNTAWLKTDFDYTPFNRDIPSADISCVYCATALDPARCIAESTEFFSVPRPTTCT